MLNFYSLVFFIVLLYQADSKCALVYGQMNEPPGARARVGLTGLTVAEHFRDAEGQDVLLFIDNIFRFTQVSFMIEILRHYHYAFHVAAVVNVLCPSFFCLPAG